MRQPSLSPALCMAEGSTLTKARLAQRITLPVEEEAVGSGGGEMGKRKWSTLWITSRCGVGMLHTAAGKLRVRSPLGTERRFEHADGTRCVVFTLWKVTKRALERERRLAYASSCLDAIGVLSSTRSSKCQSLHILSPRTAPTTSALAQPCGIYVFQSGYDM